MTLAYWFSRDGQAQHGSETYEVGLTYEVEGTVVPCRRGLHASPHPADALWHAWAATTVDLVELGGTVVAHGDHAGTPDKLVASRRRHIARVAAAPLLRRYVGWCALSVAHLWACPETVRRYLRATAEGEWGEEGGAEDTRRREVAHLLTGDQGPIRDTPARRAAHVAWVATRRGHVSTEAVIVACYARDALHGHPRLFVTGAGGEAAYAATVTAQRAYFEGLVRAAFEGAV